MRHDHGVVGQASDEASGSVGQAGAGDPDDRSKPRAAATGWLANESFGSVVVTDTDTGSDHCCDRAGRRVQPVGVVPVLLLTIDHDRSARQ